MADKKQQYENPFAVSLRNNNLSAEKEKIAKEKKEKHEEKMKQSVHEKMTASTLIRCYPTTVRNLRSFAEGEMKKTSDFTKNTAPGYVESEYILELTKDVHRLGEKSAAEYISKNKTILLSDHAVKVKQQDILRMKELAEKLEDEVSKEEERLEKDASNFNEFIKNVNSLTAEAFSRTMDETKVKFRKIEEVRNIKAETFLLKSEIAKLEHMLSDYLLCANFLKAAKPQEENWDDLDTLSSDTTQSEEKSETSVEKAPEFDIESIIDTEEDAPIDVPFQDASELLKAIDRFRNQNLSIVSNSHYITNTLRDAKETFESVKKQMEDAIEDRQKRIGELKSEIKSNEETVDRLKTLTSAAVLQSASEEKRFEENLAPEVEATYEICTGIKGGNLSLTMMVNAVESFVLQLILDIQKLPEKSLHKAYRLKQLERKIQKRKENEERRAKAQQERMLKYDSRQAEPPKLKLRRRLMYVAKPAEHILKKIEQAKTVSEEKDDDDYFFS